MPVRVVGIVVEEGVYLIGRGFIVVEEMAVANPALSVMAIALFICYRLSDSIINTIHNLQNKAKIRADKKNQISRLQTLLNNNFLTNDEYEAAKNYLH